MGKRGSQKETKDSKENGSAGKEDRKETGNGKTIHKDKSIFLFPAPDDETRMEQSGCRLLGGKRMDRENTSMETRKIVKHDIQMSCFV